MIVATSSPGCLSTTRPEIIREGPKLNEQKRVCPSPFTPEKRNMAITPVQDKTITRQVQGKLTGRGLGSPCHISVETRKGEVTLTGSVQYAHQKSTAVQAANGIGGVKRVMDRLMVKAVAKV